MNFIRDLFREGRIDVRSYERLKKVINHLEDSNYKCIEIIGRGSYGFVMKVQHIRTGEERAVKVVCKDRTSVGEIQIWPSLNHKNILRLLFCECYAESYLFYTDIHPCTVEEEVVERILTDEPGEFDEASNWLKDIVDGVRYLHDQDLAHLDIKSNNVLISKDRKAILMDFGFITSTKKPIDRY